MFSTKKGKASPVLALSHIASQASGPHFLTATSLPADILTIPSRSKTAAACTGSLFWWIIYKKFYSICSNVFTHSLTHSLLCIQSSKVKNRLSTTLVSARHLKYIIWFSYARIPWGSYYHLWFNIIHICRWRKKESLTVINVQIYKASKWQRQFKSPWPNSSCCL